MMPVPKETLLLQFIFLAFCIVTSSATRSKRQIIFEDDDRSRPVNADCYTPDRVGGRCIRWTECDSLRRIANWNRLQAYVCGFSGSEPRLCCPIEDDDRSLPATRRPTRRTTPTRRRTTTTTTRRPAPVVSTRRTTARTTTTTRRPPLVGFGQKPRFLPQRCGMSLNETDRRIVGGQEAQRGAWPWMAVVLVVKRSGAKSPDCGGALVTSRHVITAAHCVVSGRGSTTLTPRLISVRLGAHDLRSENEAGSMEVGVDAVRRHERFDPRTYKNDIAVLRLNREVRFTNLIGPVCLPYDVDFSQPRLTSKTSTVTGFGTTEFNGPSSDVLREASFDIYDQNECIKAYERELNITDEYICAGTADGSKDSCQGDSGGPLVTTDPQGDYYYLVGVVSFGKLCATPGYPGVYTRVTKYLDWLRTNLAD